MFIKLHLRLSSNVNIKRKNGFWFSLKKYGEIIFKKTLSRSFSNHYHEFQRNKIECVQKFNMHTQDNQT